MTQGPRREQRGQRNVPGLQVETRFLVMRRDETGPEGLERRDERVLASWSKVIGLKDFQQNAMDAKLMSLEIEKQIRNRRTLFGRLKTGQEMQQIWSILKVGSRFSTLSWPEL